MQELTKLKSWKLEVGTNHLEGNKGFRKSTVILEVTRGSYSFHGRSQQVIKQRGTGLQQQYLHGQGRQLLGNATRLVTTETGDGLGLSFHSAVNPLCRVVMQAILYHQPSLDMDVEAKMKIPKECSEDGAAQTGP